LGNPLINRIAFLPQNHWLNTYQRRYLAQDLSAAAVVTVLLIPQSLAYAMLAGVPPEVGLYASILPLVAYALFGTSRTLSVGPVAIISLMTATTLGSVAAEGTASYLTAASVLAMLSGLFLLAMGILRLGFISHFLSHAVISGFISASGVLIALGQISHILGVSATGNTMVDLLPALLANLSDIQWPTLAIGGFALLFLYLSRIRFLRWLTYAGLSPHLASIALKTAPIVVVGLTASSAYLWQLESAGVSLTGTVPAGLPTIGFSMPSSELVRQLALPALLMSLIGYVESISIGRTLASKRQQKIDPNQELVGLGMANVASSVSGGIPVTGGFSRSVVNFDAGAVTQAASIMTAVGIAMASLFLTPLLYYLPKATLAAIIIVAVASLVDTSILQKTWRFSRSDFWAVMTTVVVTLLAGVEAGLACGVGLSIALHLYRTSKPHIAEVGLIEGTEHFRNVRRYKVETLPHVITLRPDESLFFANAAYLEDKVHEAIYERDSIAHVIVLCSAVNEVDFSALETLEALNKYLANQGIKLHLSEVKGPVMDRLVSTGLLAHLGGQVYISQFEAFEDLRESVQRETDPPIMDLTSDSISTRNTS